MRRADAVFGQAAASIGFHHSGPNGLLVHSLDVLLRAAVFTEDPEVLRAAFLHDIGKALPKARGETHEAAGAAWCRANGESEKTVDLVLTHHNREGKRVDNPVTYADSWSAAEWKASVLGPTFRRWRPRPIRLTLDIFREEYYILPICALMAEYRYRLVRCPPTYFHRSALRATFPPSRHLASVWGDLLLDVLSDWTPDPRHEHAPMATVFSVPRVVTEPCVVFVSVGDSPCLRSVSLPPGCLTIKFHGWNGWYGGGKSGPSASPRHFQRPPSGPVLTA
ncbi:MAG: hypothetical protein KatS3mg082_1459 [Nitrospiraceae bacterium]|nr:MAG: hypothetical protein KatS3mg082_1459 [Nitrospiraceae bacterium]